MNDVILTDCLEGLLKLADNSIDVIITDPPYWLGSKLYIDDIGQYVGSITDCKHTGKTWKIGDGYWVEEIYKQYFRVLKYGGYVLNFAIDRFVDLQTYNARKNGFDICQSIYWQFKPGMPKGTNTSKRVDALLLQGSASTKALRQQEFANQSGDLIEVKSGNNGFVNDVKVVQRKTNTIPITEQGKKYKGSVYGSACLAPEIEVICLYRKPCKYSNIAEDVAKSVRDKEVHPSVVFVDKYKEKHGHFPSQVLKVSKPSKKEREEAGNHPTLKPIALMEDLITLFTKEGDIVLDAFCGSGTTLKAAYNLNRQWLGFEINQQYYLIAKKRLENLN